MLPIVLTYIKNVDADLTTRAMFAFHLKALKAATPLNVIMKL